MKGLDPFYPFLPGDFSCGSMGRIHHNASTLWLLAVASYVATGRHRETTFAFAQCQAHIQMRNLYWFMAEMNEPPKPEVIVILL